MKVKQLTKAKEGLITTSAKHLEMPIILGAVYSITLLVSYFNNGLFFKELSLVVIIICMLMLHKPTNTPK